MIVIFLFAGCQNNSSSNSQNSSKASTAENNDNSQKMKENFQSKLKELVTAGTITEAQSSKILSALTTNMGKMGNGARPENGGNPPDKSSSQQLGNKDDGQSSNNGQTPDNGNGQQDRSKNPLSQLVTDGVITQDQADKVMTALMGDRQGNLNSQGDTKNSDNVNSSASSKNTTIQ